MADVLLTWELGGGLGHLVNLRPFATELSRRGHRVGAVLKDTSAAALVFKGAQVKFFAPPSLCTPAVANERPSTFAQILCNNGFNDEETLWSRANAWRKIFIDCRPDLVVFDHSPTALVASQGLAIHRIAVGTGFFTPPNCYPLPALRSVEEIDAEACRHDEDSLLERINRVLARWSVPPLSRLSQLYADLDRNYLATFRELDHYPNRGVSRYIGCWSAEIGRAPAWPPGSGPRIYVYVKPFPAVEELMAVLGALGLPTLVYASGFSEAVLSQFQTKHLRFFSDPLDISQVSKQCDLAILNGNHGTTVEMLLAGKPSLQIPLHLEQAIFAEAVVRLGGAMRVGNRDGGRIAAVLSEMLGDDKYRKAASHFANRHADHNPKRAVVEMIDDVETVLGTSACRPVGKANCRVMQVDPSELIHFKRFDVMAKYIYARHHRLQVRSSWARRLYLTHLHVLNNFKEASPPKCGPDDFLKSFHKTIDNVGENGFRPGISVVPVGQDLAILNGAHRLAACLAFSQPITYRIHNCRSGFDFSSAWFRRRRCHVATGLPSWCADAMAIEYCRLKPSSALVLVGHGPSDQQVIAELDAMGTLVYARNVVLKGRGAMNLSVLLDKANNSPSSGGGLRFKDGVLRVFVWEPDQHLSSNALRSDVVPRISSALGTIVGITECPERTLSLAELLLNPNGRQFLTLGRAIMGTRLKKQLNVLNQEVTESRLDRESLCIVEQRVLAPYRKGDIGRLEVLTRTDAVHIPSKISTARQDAITDSLNLGIDDLIFDPSLHFVFNGWKFASLTRIAANK